MKTQGMLSAAFLFVSLILSCSPESRPSADTKAPDEPAALATLKDINRAQADFIRRTRRYAQTFDELVAQHLMSAEPTVGGTGYEFLLRPSPDAVSYTVVATPTDGKARHFFMDQTGVIRGETGKPATATSPEI
jgi:hypothetical protein